MKISYGTSCSRLALVGVACAAALPSPAAAQVNQPASTTAAAREDSDAQDIVVTARLRKERLDRVPDSITAFSSRTIEERSLKGLADYLALTPNAKIVQENDSSSSEVYIRGVGSNRSQAAAIAFVVDGVILPDNDSFNMDLSEADQVEILKGPQGALYGRGALAGVINIRTRDPGNEFGLDAKASIGRYNTYSGFVRVGGPIVQDKLLASVSASYNDSDGVYRNAFDGGSLYKDENWKIAGKVIAKPTETLTLKFQGSAYRQKSGNPPYSGINVLGTTGGEVTSRLAGAPISYDIPNISKRRVYGASVVAELDLGMGVLRSTTAYNRVNFNNPQQDTDTTALSIAVAGATRKSSAVSEELRFTSTDDRPLRYILTGYVQRNKVDRTIDANFDFCFLGLIPCPTPPLTPSGILIPLAVEDTNTKVRESAVSAQVNYDLTPQIELTAALRYDRNQQRRVNNLLAITQKAVFDEWQPKASISYRPSERAMIYATYSQGFKPGTFNPPVAPASIFSEIVKAEQTKNFDIGTKMNFFQRRLLINTSIFYTRYSNTQEFQVDLLSGGILNINIDQSDIHGFEVDMTARPMRGLELSSAFGYVKSTIKKYDRAPAYIGQSLPYQARYTVNLAGQYRFAVTDDVNAMLRVDYARSGKTSYQDFRNPNPNQFLYQKSSDTVDARASLTKGAWTLSAFGKNVLNSKYVDSAYSRWIGSVLFVPLNIDLLLPAPGATYGLEARVRF